MIAMTDRYSKFTRAVTTAKTRAPEVANMLSDYWIVRFGVTSYLLTQISPQFVLKVFPIIYGYIAVKHLTTTPYHPQTSGRVERYSRTIVTRLRHYIVEYQRDWDFVVGPLTFPYKKYVNRSTDNSPYNLELSPYHRDHR